MAQTGKGSTRPLGLAQPADSDEILAGPLDPESEHPSDDELRALEPTNLIRSKETDNDGD